MTKTLKSIIIKGETIATIAMKMMYVRGLPFAYLPQFDAHNHSQLSVWYQGADWSLTGQFNDLDLQGDIIIIL